MSYEKSAMTKVMDEKGTLLLRNWYSNKMLVRQDFANGTLGSYHYQWARGVRYPEKPQLGSQVGWTKRCGSQTPSLSTFAVLPIELTAGKPIQRRLFRSSLRKILPDAVFGMESTKRTARGCL